MVNCACMELLAVLVGKNTTSLVLAGDYCALVSVAISCNVGLGHGLGTCLTGV
jgi:hypothetical protein